MKPLFALYQKELRQNSFIYIFPFFLICLALFFQNTVTKILSETWTKNIALALPVAFATSYGLQAFDLEENSQTRDFLLTKPLAVSEIINAKFWSGLVILIIISFSWLAALAPRMVLLPDFSDFYSLWTLAFILFIVVVYSISFSAGVWIKGPKKLFVAVFGAIAGVSWFFYSWLQFLTSLYLSLITDSLLTYFAILIGTLLLLLLIVRFLLETVAVNLQNHLLSEIYPKFKIYICLFLIPVVLNIANLYAKPEISPFKSLFSCLNGTEEWFQAVDIAKQPYGSLYALTDVRGRLGITKRGGKPEVIYRGEKKKNNILAKPVWSPDGSGIAFTENGKIKILSLFQKKPVTLIPGDMAFWSSDSNILLVVTKRKTSIVQNKGYSIPVNFYRLSYFFLRSNQQYDFQGDLSFAGSSMNWNSDLNTLVGVTDFWEIALMNLNNGKVDLINLPRPKKPAPIFLTKISSLGPDLYRIAIFTDLKVFNAKKTRYQYNLNLYDFALKGQKAVLKSRLLDLEYQDVLIDAGNGEIWGDSSFGVYRKIHHFR